eukprot:scaffold153612_cov22-Tisochrysis_lutea.AAC.1
MQPHSRAAAAHSAPPSRSRPPAAAPLHTHPSCCCLRQCCRCWNAGGHGTCGGCVQRVPPGWWLPHTQPQQLAHSPRLLPCTSSSPHPECGCCCPQYESQQRGHGRARCVKGRQGWLQHLGRLGVPATYHSSCPHQCGPPALAPLPPCTYRWAALAGPQGLLLLHQLLSPVCVRGAAVGKRWTGR